jgi:hypothetical protein
VNIEKPYKVRVLFIAKVLLAPVGGDTGKELCPCDELLGGRVGEGLDRDLDGLQRVVVAAVVVSELLVFRDEVVHHVATSP